MAGNFTFQCSSLFSMNCLNMLDSIYYGYNKWYDMMIWQSHKLWPSPSVTERNAENEKDGDSVCFRKALAVVYFVNISCVLSLVIVHDSLVN